MAASDPSRRTAAASAGDDDSAVTLLQHLNSERGRTFTEAEYHEMRRVIVEELSRGARCRPFTLFTFGVVGTGFLGLLLLGLFISDSGARDGHMLAWASGGALVAWGYCLWSYFRAIRGDSQRTLAGRLVELEELRSKALITADEYDTIRAAILISRQAARHS